MSDTHRRTDRYTVQPGMVATPRASRRSPRCMEPGWLIHDTERDGIHSQHFTHASALTIAARLNSRDQSAPPIKETPACS